MGWRRFFFAACNFSFVLTLAAGEYASAVYEFDSRAVDLTDFYGKVTGTQGDTWFSHEDWKIVPKGLQTFDGIVFDVSGNLLLKSVHAPQVKEAVRGIPVKSRCRYIHLLHAIGYAEDEGATVAVLEIHYASGATREFPIIYGVHVRNWWKEKFEEKKDLFDLSSSVAWAGQGTYPPPERASVRLFRTTFVIPLLNDRIDHIDFISKNTRATLCIVAVSIGDKKPVPALSKTNLP